MGHFNCRKAGKLSLLNNKRSPSTILLVGNGRPNGWRCPLLSNLKHLLINPLKYYTFTFTSGESKKSSFDVLIIEAINPIVLSQSVVTRLWLENATRRGSYWGAPFATADHDMFSEFQMCALEVCLNYMQYIFCTEPLKLIYKVSAREKKRDTQFTKYI